MAEFKIEKIEIEINQQTDEQSVLDSSKFIQQFTAASSNHPISDLKSNKKRVPKRKSKEENSFNQEMMSSLKISSNGIKNDNRNNRQQQQQQQPIFYYEPYWSLKDVEDALQAKTLIKSKLRINPRNYKDAYLSDPNDTTQTDVFVEDVKSRNRALHGDLVGAKYKEKFEWKIVENFKQNVLNCLNDFIEKFKVSNPNLKIQMNNKKAPDQQQRSDKRDCLMDLTIPFFYKNKDLLQLLDDKWFQKTAKVVFIYEKKNLRTAAGHLKLFPDFNNQWVQFSPVDSRLPRMQIPLFECPFDFYLNSQNYQKTLFLAQIVEMPEATNYAIGTLKCIIGRDGDIGAETEAILLENGVDSTELNEDLLKDCLPKLPWKIPDHEYSYRKDLRDHCVFTIDPSTARDLDDALHIVQLSDDIYEVGVHIADVSYFVEQNSPIDKIASERTTSVYLVQKVIPMLPRCLCENLCSLNPNEERLTFSVIWKINSSGDILEEWFGRSIINSVSKLSYENAQKFIENPDRDFTNPDEFPRIRDGYTLRQVKDSVLNLDKIARNLRIKRYSKGCLSLTQTKLSFIINKETSMPFAYNVYEQKDSNKLVEEFMLLANIAVAHRIYDKYPQHSVLRRHPPPNSQQIQQVSDMVKDYGHHVDIASSNKIQTFLHELEKQKNETSKIAFVTLTCLVTKTMQLAQYFCSGTLVKENYAHYGLAVPLYTHFTSPIRRYPDILVHRLLASSLGYIKCENVDPHYIQIVCELCNDKKYSARVCSERSSEMYFSLFVNECGPIDQEGYVVAIKDHSFDVLVYSLGVVKRVYCDKLEIIENSIEYIKSETKPELKFTWKSTEAHLETVNQTIKLFTKVNVSLLKHESDPFKYNMIIKHPNDSLKSKIVDETQVKSVNDGDATLIEQRVDADPNIYD